MQEFIFTIVNVCFSGIVDSSGLKFVYTSQLRQYDVGILETGRVVFPFSHLIPPNAENFVTYGECPSGCIAPVSNARKR